MFGRRRGSALLDVTVKGLEGWDYEVTSDITYEYNCLAHAADEDFRWWWPAKEYDTYWPEEAPCEVTREAFVLAYASIGYEVCDDAAYDPSYEKIALFFESDIPTHAAKQIDAMHWTSKLGAFHDIRHPLRALEEYYGRALVFLHRKRKGVLRP